MPADVFASRRLLVTGGSGFLGRHVIAALQKRGARDIFVPRSKDYDLTNHADVVRLYKDAKPDLVIHLAAEVGGIGANMANPGRYAYANLMMGAHMIEEGRLAHLNKFVQIGTICAYPKFTPVPFKEEDIWNGYPEETNAPYGIAKKTLMVLLQSYRQQYSFNGIYLLPVNLYGPHDNFDPRTSHVIPAIIRKMLEAKAAGQKEITLWGTGAASREFLFVEDCAEAIALAAEKYESSEPVNLGSGSEITVKELAALIAELTGFTGTIKWDSSKPDGQPRRSLDTRKAAERFGFKAHTPLKEGLKKTIDWYVREGQGAKT